MVPKQRERRTVEAPREDAGEVVSEPRTEPLRIRRPVGGGAFPAIEGSGIGVCARAGGVRIRLYAKIGGNARPSSYGYGAKVFYFTDTGR